MFTIKENKTFQAPAEADPQDPLPVFIQPLDENKEPWLGFDAKQAEFHAIGELTFKATFLTPKKLRKERMLSASFIMITGWKPGGKWIADSSGRGFSYGNADSCTINVPVSLLK